MELLESASILPKDNPVKTRFDFVWETTPLSQGVENLVIDTVLSERHYGYMSTEEEAEAKKQLSILQLHNGENEALSWRMVLSLRKVLNDTDRTKSHHRVKRYGPQIVRQFNKGHSLVSIAKQLNTAPLDVGRVALSCRSLSKPQIRKILVDLEDAYEGERIKLGLRTGASNINFSNETLSRLSRTHNLSQTDILNLIDAIACDIGGRANQGKQEEHATRFEDLLCSYFCRFGVGFLTEDELKRKNQILRKCVPTPDILFTDEVYINGEKCSWVDAKNFYGAGVYSMYRGKLREQASRFTAAYGNGALVFSRGFCDGLHIAGAQLLDCTDNAHLSFESE